MQEFLHRTESHRVGMGVVTSSRGSSGDLSVHAAGWCAQEFGRTPARGRGYVGLDRGHGPL